MGSIRKCAFCAHRHSVLAHFYGGGASYYFDGKNENYVHFEPTF